MNPKIADRIAQCTFAAGGAIVAFCIGMAIITWHGNADEETPIRYHPVVLDESEIYDGDTLQDVYIKILDQDDSKHDPQLLWPGVYYRNNDVYIHTDIRIAGIDTPEKRPRKAGRTAKSLAAEKAAAKHAQQALADFLEKHNFVLYLSNPQLGKYAGRIVADLHAGEGKHNVADHMIEQGHAKTYDGGTKPKWDF